MKLKRFDEIEFVVLDIVHRGMGYYPSGENADRAELLMSEGILVSSPRSEWQKSGWKFTDDGKALYDKFIARLRKRHGHIWVTRNEAYDDNDLGGNEPYRFAYAVGYHNGYECKNCGFTFCVHCTNEFSIPKCSHENNSG